MNAMPATLILPLSAVSVPPQSHTHTHTQHTIPAAMHARTHTRLGCARQVRARWPSPTWSSRRSRSCPSSWASSSCLFSKVNLNPEPHTRSLGVSFPLPRACVCVVCCVCVRAVCAVCVSARAHVDVCDGHARHPRAALALSVTESCVCMCVCVFAPSSVAKGRVCVCACVSVCLCVSLSVSVCVFVFALSIAKGKRMLPAHPLRACEQGRGFRL